MPPKWVKTLQINSLLIKRLQRKSSQQKEDSTNNLKSMLLKSDLENKKKPAKRKMLPRA